MQNLLNELRILLDQQFFVDNKIGQFEDLSSLKYIRSIQLLAGDASLRKYYRIRTADQSYILMKLDPFERLSSDLPFLVVRHYLHACDIDVPYVVEVDSERGMLLLEDLGDVTLLHQLKKVSSYQEESELYQKVIQILVQFQFNTLNKELTLDRTKLNFFQLRFDYQKLMWEVNFAVENFYEKLLKKTILDFDKKHLYSKFGQICQTLAKEPVVLAHRDFHSKNIMIHSEKIFMIDFQDARMGPMQYDLVSLIKDSYYQLAESNEEMLILFYIKTYESIFNRKIDFERFMKIFDLMVLQRGFKAIGSFASFMNRYHNPQYLKYIGNTFESMRRVFLRNKEYDSLKEVLFEYYHF